MISEAIQRLISLDKKKEEVKKYFEELEEATKAVHAELGMSGSFQDPTDGTVFQIVQPEGTFTKFKTIDYQRTRREGEKKGSLSLTKARDLGYEVE